MDAFKGTFEYELVERLHSSDVIHNTHILRSIVAQTVVVDALRRALPSLSSKQVEAGAFMVFIDTMPLFHGLLDHACTHITPTQANALRRVSLILREWHSVPDELASNQYWESWIHQKMS